MAEAMCLCVPTNSMQQVLKQPRLLAGAWGKDGGRKSLLRDTVSMPSSSFLSEVIEHLRGAGHPSWELIEQNPCPLVLSGYILIREVKINNKLKSSMVPGGSKCFEDKHIC